MPAKMYFIHFKDSVPPKDRGAVLKYLRENGLMCDVAASLKSSHPTLPVPPVPTIDYIRVIDEYGNFGSLIVGKLPEGSSVTVR